MSDVIGIMQQVAEKEANTQLTTELGMVTAVFPHADEGDTDNYQCSVILKNRMTVDNTPIEFSRVPVATPYMGLACIPNVDDLVIVNFISGDINAPVITGRLYNDQDRPPANQEGEFMLKHTLKEGGTLKIDTEGTVSITSKNEENVLMVNDEKATISNDKVAIEIDFSGEKITIKSTGDIELAAEGNLTMSGNEVSITSQAAMKMDAGASMDVTASGAMKLQGTTIDLN